MEPQEFQSLVKESKNAWEALGEIHYFPLYVERVTHSHRPSLYFVEDLQQGTIIQPQHIRSVRPGKGLPPKELSHILGLALMHEVKKGTPVNWDVFKAKDAH
jgi:sialic acid synthase SpsE